MHHVYRIIFIYFIQCYTFVYFTCDFRAPTVNPNFGGNVRPHSTNATRPTTTNQNSVPNSKVCSVKRFVHCISIFVALFVLTMLKELSLPVNNIINNIFLACSLISSGYKCLSLCMKFIRLASNIEHDECQYFLQSGLLAR